MGRGQSNKEGRQGIGWDRDQQEENSRDKWQKDGGRLPKKGGGDSQCSTWVGQDSVKEVQGTRRKVRGEARSQGYER